MSHARWLRWDVVSLTISALGLVGIVGTLVSDSWWKPGWPVVVFLNVLVVASLCSIVAKRALRSRAARLQDVPIPVGVRLVTPIWIRCFAEGPGTVALGAGPAVMAAALGFPGVGLGIQFVACGAAIFTTVVTLEVLPPLTFEARGLRVHSRDMHFLVPWQSMICVDCDGDTGATQIDIEDPHVVLDSASPKDRRSERWVWAFLKTGGRRGSSMSLPEWTAGLDTLTLTRAITDRVTGRCEQDEDVLTPDRSSSGAAQEVAFATYPSPEPPQLEIHEADEQRTRWDVLLAISSFLVLALVGAAIAGGFRSGALWSVAAFLVVSATCAIYLVTTEHVMRRRVSTVVATRVPRGVRLRKPRWMVSHLLLLPIAFAAWVAAVVASAGAPAIGLGFLLSLGGFGGALVYAVLDETLDITFEDAGLWIHRGRFKCLISWSSIFAIDVRGPEKRRRILLTVVDPEDIAASAVPKDAKLRTEMKRFIHWLSPAEGLIRLLPWTGGFDAVSLARAIREAAVPRNVPVN